VHPIDATRPPATRDDWPLVMGTCPSAFALEDMTRRAARVFV